MLRKTIEIATPGTRLSVAHRQLVIERPELPKATLPIEDIGVLIVDDRRASYTQSVFIELLAAGATVMITGPDHLPLGMMLPLDAHHVQTERHRAQVEASEPARKQIWRALVAAKLSQQSCVLDRFDPAPQRPRRHGRAASARAIPTISRRRARSATGRCCSARIFAATAPPKASTPRSITATPSCAPPLARAVVASGLIPSLGVFHKNRGNPFCLADDLFEPYRPFVDWRVKLLTLRTLAPPSLDDRATRAALLSLFNETILVGERKLPLLLAMQASAASLCRALTSAGSQARFARRIAARA